MREAKERTLRNKQLNCTLKFFSFIKRRSNKEFEKSQERYQVKQLRYEEGTILSEKYHNHSMDISIWIISFHEVEEIENISSV